MNIDNKQFDENKYIIGIDLGTTNSVISYYNVADQMAVPIDTSNGFGKIPMPSVVQYRKEGKEIEWVVGSEAYESLKIYKDETIRSIKRKMGTDEKIVVEGNSYYPEHISAMILEALINHIRGINPNMEIEEVAVSIPYGFDDAAKKATLRACHLAGLLDTKISLIEEPMAATLAYIISNDLKKDEKIMVFDFGGGTLDITIFHVVKKTHDMIRLKVVSEGGETYHGGDNVDDLLLKRLYEMIEENGSIDIDALTNIQQAELMKQARDVKERLSLVKKYRIPFTFVVPPFAKAITREEFENLIEPFINKTRKLVLKSLVDGYEGKIKPEMIDRVILEGGSSSMPWVKELLVSIFNDEDKIYSSKKPALDISLGATYYLAIKQGLLKKESIESTSGQIDFELCVPHDIGFEVEIGDKKVFHTMLQRGTPYILAKKTQIFTLSGNSKEDMTRLHIKILERIHKGDSLDRCRLVGNVDIEGLPERPSGKTMLKVTLVMNGKNSTVKGTVEDLGYKDEYTPSGYNREFIPIRNEHIRIK